MATKNLLFFARGSYLDARAALKSPHLELRIQALKHLNQNYSKLSG